MNDILDNNEYLEELNLSEEEEKDLVKQCQDFITRAEQYRSPYKEDWKAFYKMRMNYMDTLEYEREWESNTSVPLAPMMLYTVVPSLTEAFMNPLKNFCTIKPNNLNSPVDNWKKDITDKIISCQLRKMKYSRSMVTTMMESGTYGTAIQKVSWERKIKHLKRTKKMKVPMFDQIFEMAAGVERRPITTFDGPMVTPIDLWSFLPDPTAFYGEFLEEYCHFAYLSEKQIRNLFKKGPDGQAVFHTKNRDFDMETLEDMGHQDQGPAEREDLMGYNDYRFFQGDEKRYEVIEWYKDGWFIFILNRKFIVRSEWEPFFNGGNNIISYPYIPKEYSFYGIGLCELLYEISSDMTWQHNARNNWIIMQLNSPWFVGQGKLTDPRDLDKMWPFKKIEINEGEDLNKIIRRAFDGRDTPFAAFYQEEDRKKQMASDITGINDYFRGMNSPSMNDTATGVTTLTNQSQARFRFHLLYNAQNGVVPTVEKMIGLNNLFLTNEQTFNLTEDESVKANKDMIIEDFDVIPTYDPNSSTKEANKQLIMTLLQTVGGIPQMANSQKWDALARRVYKIMEIENPEELCMTTQEIQMQQQQQMQMQQQQMAQQQQMQQQQAQQQEASHQKERMEKREDLVFGEQVKGFNHPAKQPPMENAIDVTKKNARGAIGNSDKNFE
jgi:hypothetical protein